MYQALYRKYRPKTFDEVVGQEVIVKTLKNAIKNNCVSHAYLFAGPRGTGKTSIAKIFAKILNCQNLDGFTPCNKCVSCEQADNNQNIDIIEIDAASNNGVDEIREIRNKITLVPTNSKYKIYIVDEVHMLTTQAFNALLKSLEEPPAHIIFIFATTEPHKIPKTILSRCQRFDYKKVTDDQIVDRLSFIATKEKIKITEESLKEIAKLSDGGMRDSISLLDQSLAYSDGEITINDIHDINGTITDDDLNNFIFNILNKDLINLLKLLEEYDNKGKNFVKIIQELINKLKDCLIYNNAQELINYDLAFFKKIKDLNVDHDIYKIIKVLSNLLGELKTVNNNKLLLEIEFIKLLSDSNSSSSIDVPKIIEKSKKEDNKEKSAKEVKSVAKQAKTDFNKEKFEEFKKIRVNNALSKFSQTERRKIKDKLLVIDDYLSDNRFGSVASLLKDGELKAVSDNYLMFMYKTELMTNLFNKDIKLIEELLEQSLYETFKVIAINPNDWSYIREDYNKNKDKYAFIEETVSIEDIFNLNVKQKDDSNSIDEMFNDIIEYE